MPAGTTRERIVITAARMFRAQGVTGTGMLAILEAAAAPRGSLYHHFPGGKDELVLEALRFEAGRVSDGLGLLLIDLPDEAAALVAFAETLAVSLERSDYKLGCPISTAALELSSISEPVRRLCARAYEDWQTKLRDHLVSVGRDPADAATRAELVLAAYEGALLLARARRDGDVLRRIATALIPSARPRG